MINHLRSLQNYTQWEEYDRQKDIGLMTLYHPDKKMHPKERIRTFQSSPTKIKYVQRYTTDHRELDDDARYKSGFQYASDQQFELEKRISGQCRAITKKLHWQQKLNNRIETPVERNPQQQEHENSNKKAIKADIFNFESVDRLSWMKSRRNCKSNEAKLNQRKLCVKDEFCKIINKHHQNSELISDKDRSLKQCKTNVRADSSSERKSNYMDYVIVSLDGHQSNQHVSNREERVKLGLNKFISRQKSRSRGIQERKRMESAHSNLLSGKLTPSLMASRRSQGDSSDPNRLKQVFKLFFSEQKQNQKKLIILD